MCVTSLRLTLEKTSLWLEEKITVGRSEQAKMFVVDSDLCRSRGQLGRGGEGRGGAGSYLKLRSTVGCVPSVTFLRLLSAPECGSSVK